MFNYKRPDRRSIFTLVVAFMLWLLGLYRDRIANAILDRVEPMTGHAMAAFLTWPYLSWIGTVLILALIFWAFVDFAPRVRAEIVRFEALDPADPMIREYAERTPDMLAKWIANGTTYVALIALETNQNISARTQNWSFTARTASGTDILAKIVDYGWGPPSGWDSNLRAFSTIDGLRLEKGSLTNAFVYLGIKPQDVDSTWLSATLWDDRGKRTIFYHAEGSP